MNTISKIHQCFSEFLINSRVLSNPEEFLGPNYEAVLDFWLILDDLTKDQLMTIESRYDYFYIYQRSEWCKARDEAIKASNETIVEMLAVYVVFAAHVVYGWNAYRATQELIGMHLILEQNKPLTFFPMFLNVL